MAMEINEFEVNIKGRDTPIRMGLHLGKKLGQTIVNIFALEENKGPLVSKHLLEVIKAVAEEILMGAKTDAVDWTFTARNRTTAINVTNLAGNPIKLDISDMHALEYEKTFGGYPKDKYATDFGGHLPSDVSKGRYLTRELDPSPATVFSVPCAHPAAKDGIVPCIPTPYDGGGKDSRYETILVDTRKMIEQLSRNDAQMLKHADYKFSGKTVAGQISHVALDNPLDMGDWGPTADYKGITMGAGDAENIRLAQELNLPFFPIAVDKAHGKAFLDMVRRDVGYMSSGISDPAPAAPAFKS